MVQSSVLMLLLKGDLLCKERSSELPYSDNESSKYCAMVQYAAGTLGLETISKAASPSVTVAVLAQGNMSTSLSPRVALSIEHRA